MLSFLKKKQPRVGLDISSTAVKVLQLSQSGGQLRVDHYAVEPLPPNAVSTSNIENPEAVGEAVARARQRCATKTKEAVMAVSGSSVISKVITMPAHLNDNDLAAQVEYEAGNHIPYPLDEVSTDFQVIGPVENNPEAIQVLLAACRTENIDDRVAAAELGGFDCRVMDIEAFAEANAFELIAERDRIGLDEVVALVDVGAVRTSLVVIRGNRTLYTREQSFGGKQLTEEIMREYGISYEEAGLAKRQGGLPDSYEEKILEPFKENLIAQINRSLQFFYTASEYDTVSRIYLAGGCASIQGIDQAAQDQLGLPVKVANPLDGLTRAARINDEALADDAPALMIAFGLALRSFDS